VRGVGGVLSGLGFDPLSRFFLAFGKRCDKLAAEEIPKIVEVAYARLLYRTSHP
jgi:hypothetical protein